MIIFFLCFPLGKLRIRVKETANGTLICPICIEPLKGTKNEINLHLENCSSSRVKNYYHIYSSYKYNSLHPVYNDYLIFLIKQTNSSSDGEKDIDIETTTGPTTSSIHEIFEEYEWAGQKRIRTISLLNNAAKG